LRGTQGVKRELVPEHKWLKKQVRVVAEVQNEGRCGEVTAVYRFFETDDEDEETFEVHVFSTTGVFTARLADVEEDKPGKREPTSFKLDFRRIKANKRAALKRLLEGEDENLELIAKGTLIEQSTVAAILTEMEMRLDPKETSIIKPSITTPWTLHEIDYDAGGEMAVSKLQLQTTKHVFYLLWSDAPRHYTYLYVRSIEGEPRHIEFKDSCPNEAARLAATKLLRNLELIGIEEQAPAPSNRINQSDAWSCGLWASRWVERQIRENLGEPRLPPLSIGEMSSRANEFISKIKQASGPEAGEKKPGKGKLEIGKPRPTHEPEFLTFEAAEAGAFLCTKCLPTRTGTKGCRACMGEWFQQVRLGSRSVHKPPISSEQL
jgi:hypothetical protein